MNSDRLVIINGRQWGVKGPHYPGATGQPKLKYSASASVL
jgi:hypothetical protein